MTVRRRKDLCDSRLSIPRFVSHAHCEEQHPLADPCRRLPSRRVERVDLASLRNASNPCRSLPNEAFLHQGTYVLGDVAGIDAHGLPNPVRREFGREFRCI